MRNARPHFGFWQTSGGGYEHSLQQCLCPLAALLRVVWKALEHCLFSQTRNTLFLCSMRAQATEQHVWPFLDEWNAAPHCLHSRACFACLAVSRVALVLNASRHFLHRFGFLPRTPFLKMAQPQSQHSNDMPAACEARQMFSTYPCAITRRSVLMGKPWGLLWHRA